MCRNEAWRHKRMTSQTSLDVSSAKLPSYFMMITAKPTDIKGGRPSTNVNGDIAIQWEWSNFDPSQNQNPLTDYDNTLHNWLRRRDEHVTQNLCQSTLRERLGKYVKYKALSFFWLIFPPDSPTEATRAWNFTRDVSKHALWRKEMPFWGPHDGRQHLGFQIPPKPSKMAFDQHFRAFANGLETNDVIKDWRHWLAVARRPLRRRPILFIASGKILQLRILQYLQRNDSVSWYGNSVFAKFTQYL